MFGASADPSTVAVRFLATAGWSLEDALRVQALARHARQVRACVAVNGSPSRLRALRDVAVQLALVAAPMFTEVGRAAAFGWAEVLAGCPAELLADLNRNWTSEGADADGVLAYVRWARIAGDARALAAAAGMSEAEARVATLDVQALGVLATLRGYRLP